VICEYTYSNHFTPLLFIPFYHILLTAAELRGMNPERFKQVYLLSWLLEYRFRFFLIRLSFKIIYVFHGNSLWCFSFRMSYDKKKMKRHWDIVFRLYKFTKYKRKLFYRKPSVEINKMSICDPNGFKYTGGLLTSLSNQKI
jgi:hypothetical protein